MTDTLHISVAVPAYDRPSYLAKLIATIPEDISVCVSDNNSSLAGRMPMLGNNVRVNHLDRLIPMFPNWNRALSLVNERSTHVLIPSDDDYFAHGGVDCIREVLAAHPDVDIFIFGCDFIDEADVKREGYRPAFLQAFPAGQGFFQFIYGIDARMPGIVFRKDFLDRIGGFDERFQLTAADSELIQRALLLGRSLFVPEVVGYYRIWSGSLTHSRQATDEWMQEIRLWVEKIADLILKNYGDHFGKFKPRRYKDEIIALNLLAGINGLIQRGESAKAGKFLGRHGIPRHARLRTKLHLLRSRLRILKARFS